MRLRAKPPFPIRIFGGKQVFDCRILTLFTVVYSMDCLEKDIPKLSKDVLKKIKGAIESRLIVAPAVYGKPLRYTLKNLWSLRVGDFRVIYQISDREILVLRIGHRKEVYER